MKDIKPEVIFDTPLDNEEKDEYGRGHIVDLIVNSINHLVKTDHPCTCYGIYGKWGEGKTTLMNFVEQRLLDVGSKDNLIICHYNPWIINNEEALIKEFFQSISCDTTGKIKDFLVKFGGLVAFSAKTVVNAYIPGLSKAMENVHDGLDEVVKACKEKKSLLKEKTEISNAIKKSGKHLLVFIDDVDRLDREELHAMLRLVREVADFSNVIYVLAMDVEMVSKSIASFYGKGQTEDGKRFIDKIIQVPITLPAIQPTQLQRILRTQLVSLLKEFGYNDDDVISDISEILCGLLQTKRDVIRYINQIRFVLPSLFGEVNLEDFLLVEAIKNVSEEAYVKIYHHKKDLLKIAESIPFYLDEKKEQETIDKRYEDALDDIVGCVPEQQKLFVRNMLDHHLLSNSSMISWALEDKKKLQSNIYFDKYFFQCVPEKRFSDVALDAFVSTLDDLDDSDIVDWINNNSDCHTEDELHRAIEYMVRNIQDVEQTCAAARFCHALSFSKYATGYSSYSISGISGVLVFVVNVLMRKYMYLRDESTGRLKIAEDSAQEFLDRVFADAEINYCMNLAALIDDDHFGLVIDGITSLLVLKNRYLDLSYDDQMLYDGYILYHFFKQWQKLDSASFYSYVDKALNDCPTFHKHIIKSFIYDENSVSQQMHDFVNLFRERTNAFVNLINPDDADFVNSFSVKYLLGNYKQIMSGMSIAPS